MTLCERAQEAIKNRRVSVFLKVLSVILLLGAASHLGSILGVGGTPWVARPLLFRIADSVLLPLNLILAWGLWRARLWAVFTWLACIILLQFVPFLLFTDHFASNPVEKRILYGLLATHAFLVSVFFLLLLSLRFKRASEDKR
jgi:hypothetical protein